jgi:hypothetical protein
MVSIDKLGGSQLEQSEDGSVPRILGIPEKYKGLPSELVAEMWNPAQLVDQDREATADADRTAAIEIYRQDELRQEGEVRRGHEYLFANLSANQKEQFPEAQRYAAEAVSEIVKTGVIPEAVSVSRSEQWAFQKVQEAYQEHQGQHPGEPFQFELKDPRDQAAWNNLHYRMAFARVESQSKQRDQQKLAQTRQQLGLPADVPQETVDDIGERSNGEMQWAEAVIPPSDNARALETLEGFFKKLAGKSNKPELYRDLFVEYVQKNDRGSIAETLAQSFYKQKRTVEYAINPEYQSAWEYATNDTSLPTIAQSGWIYRGNFPKQGETKTENRGSLNITLNTDAVKNLDALIANGTIDANYKFGTPDTPADASERHDAVTIYFLTQPDQKALDALSGIAAEYFRGDELLGRKISDGFALSEIGSVSDQEAMDFVEQLKGMDAVLGSAMQRYLTTANKGKSRIAMSEAAYYAAKDTLASFGIDLSYDAGKGFVLQKGDA